MQKTYLSDSTPAILRAHFIKYQNKREELGKLQFEKVLKLHSVLTPQQRQEFNRLTRDMRSYRKRRFESHPRMKNRKLMSTDNYEVLEGEEDTGSTLY